MKKILSAVLVGIFLSGLACAQTAQDDTTIRDLSELRKKLGRVKREMDLLMKDVISGASTASDAVMKEFGGDVNVDVIQNEKNIIVKADLPGMDKDRINVTLESGRILKISGSREVFKSESNQGVVRQERFSGQFDKVIELPCEVLNTGINASYKDGVLELVIPKKKQSMEEPVKINVK